MPATIHSMTALSTLPTPQVVDELNVQTILAENKALFLQMEPDYELIHEDDPVMKLLQAFSYRELHLRERINEAARANLLSFAKGADLEHLAAFYDVARLTDETDDALRYRVQLKAMGWVGNASYYKYWTLTASPLVKDVAVYSPDHSNGYNMGGRVNVAIMSHEANGVASPQLVDAVRAVLLSKDVKVLTDVLTVEAATARTIPFTVRVFLLPGTPYSVFEGLHDRFVAAFNARQQLGFDIARSWVASVLHVEGVHHVAVGYPIPAITTIAPDEFPVMGYTNIVFAGFADTELSEVDAMESRRLTRTLYDFYLRYAIANLRTAEQIAADLAEAPSAGVLQPTVRGLSEYLRIDIAKKDGQWLPEDQIAFLIFNRLQPMYRAGSVLPPF